MKNKTIIEKLLRRTAAVDLAINDCLEFQFLWYESMYQNYIEYICSFKEYYLKIKCAENALPRE